MAFAGHQAAGQRTRRGQGAEDHAEDGVLVLGAPADHFLEVREGKQRHEAHCIGTDHPVGGELVLLVVIGRHHAEQRAVGHVDGGIGHHHQQIEGIGIDAHPGRAQVRRIEQQGEDDAQRNGAENQPGTIGAPAGLGTVGDGAHQRVRHHIEQARHQHEGGGIGDREAEDIGKEQREGDGHHFPGDAASCGVSQRIADFLGEFSGHNYLCIRSLMIFCPTSSLPWTPMKSWERGP